MSFDVTIIFCHTADCRTGALAVVTLSCAWLFGWVTGQFAQRLWLKPQTGDRHRAPYSRLIELSLVSLIFIVALTLVLRPIFAAAITVTVIITLIVVNNAKYRALREPFVFTDFGLFVQAAKHPRLYLPFLEPWSTAAGLLAIVTIVTVGFAVETPLHETLGEKVLALILGFGGLAFVLLLGLASVNVAQPSFDVARDLGRFGLLPSLWLYRLAEQRHCGKGNGETSCLSRLPLRADWGAAENAQQPHIVVVQSESFFDARRLHADIRSDLLRHYDRAVAECAAHGRLTVPAWGANTMRTEFAFLTGLDGEQLGVHRFNPYRRFARRPQPSLASRLRELGYRTLCVHPYAIEFFSRHLVYPALGFDEFIDVSGFAGGERCGPYICDAAVTAKTLDLLASAREPLFLFVITMENHGPLHLEKITAGQTEGCYRRPPPPGFEDLSVYLRHLKNADRMLGELTVALAEEYPASTLTFFGDHVPSMPNVYATLHFDDGRTDYLVWRPSKVGSTKRGDIGIDALGRLMLETASLTSGPQTNSHATSP